MSECRNDGPAISRRRVLVGGALALGAVSRANAQAPALARMAAQRLGWAGVRLQVGETTLWIDPLINAAVWGEALRDTLSPIESAAGDRFVLVTHRHPDHYDPEAVARALGAGGSLLSLLARAADVPDFPALDAHLAETQERVRKRFVSILGSAP